jgi:hypothetical protein
MFLLMYEFLSLRLQRCFRGGFPDYPKELYPGIFGQCLAASAGALGS